MDHKAAFDDVVLSDPPKRIHIFESLSVTVASKEVLDDF